MSPRPRRTPPTRAEMWRRTRRKVRSGSPRLRREQAGEVGHEMSAQGQRVVADVKEKLHEQSERESEKVASSLRTFSDEARALAEGRPQEAGSARRVRRACGREGRRARRPHGAARHRRRTRRRPSVRAAAPRRVPARRGHRGLRGRSTRPRRFQRSAAGDGTGTTSRRRPQWRSGRRDRASRHVTRAECNSLSGGRRPWLRLESMISARWASCSRTSRTTSGSWSARRSSSRSRRRARRSGTLRAPARCSVSRASSGSSRC